MLMDRNLRLVKLLLCLMLFISALVPLYAQDTPSESVADEQADAEGSVDEEVLSAEAYEALSAEAADARRDNPVLIEAIHAGHLNSILYLGQIGSDDTCQKLSHYLGDPDPEVRLFAAGAAAMCQDRAPVPALILQIERETDPFIKGTLYRALGMSGREDVRSHLIDAVNETRHRRASAPVLGGALEGLMQNIVYAGLDLAALEGLKAKRILQHAASNRSEEVAFRAAYLLTRLSGLAEQFDTDKIRKAIEKSEFESVQILLMRVLSRMDAPARAAVLLDYARSSNQKLRYEALTGLGRMETEDAWRFLFTVAADDAVAVSERQLAVNGLIRKVSDGNGNGNSAQLSDLVQRLEESESPWLRARALQARLALDPSAGEELALKRVEDADYYEAFQAIAALSKTDSGKEKLKAYADASDNFVRAREARIGVDPSIEAKTEPRSTYPFEDVIKSQGKISLETTRGKIVFETLPTAPYAAHNFVSLVKAGKLDGMIWHRVIPNFVAQAGQKEDAALYDWGSIREEWAGGPHIVGSIGVATAGKDTGGTQFFINTHRNMHLNGRYTVFGQITEGLEIAERLEEGDIIKAATFEVRESDDDDEAADEAAGQAEPQP